MAPQANPGRQRSAFARFIAWVIILVWAAFWIFFNIASGFGEIAELGLTAFAMHLIMPLIILVLLWVCWRWELIGGILMLAAAIFAFYFFNVGDPRRDTLMLMVVLVLPVVASGILFILCGTASAIGQATDSDSASPN